MFTSAWILHSVSRNVHSVSRNVRSATRNGGSVTRNEDFFYAKIQLLLPTTKTFPIFLDLRPCFLYTLAYLCIPIKEDLFPHPITYGLDRNAAIGVAMTRKEFKAYFLV